jgi:glc operon protein GlcG
MVTMSLKSVVTVATLSATALFAGASFAQQPTARDAIPEKMPFNVPYGAPISLERANTAIAAAVAEGNKHGWLMNIAVMDSGGNLVAFARMDGAQLASISIAEHKARAALTFRRETKIFENALQEGNLPYVATLDGVIGSRGGIPLVEGGKMIGSIGCSGGTGSQDEAVCKVGAATVK